MKRNKTKHGNIAKRTTGSILGTATVTQLRCAIFQASVKPIYRETTILENSFGVCVVKGRLGQRHADVLETLLYCAERTRELDDGGIEILVDPAKVRKKLSDSYYSYEQLKVLIEDLRQAVVKIKSKKQEDLFFIAGFIDHVVKSPFTKYDPLRKAERNLWRVRLGLGYSVLLANDIVLYYDPEPINNLRYGISKAVARYVLSHKTEPNGGWKLDGIFHVLQPNATKKTKEHFKYRLKKEREKLEACGVTITQDRIRKLHHKNKPK
ncbi:MAG: ABC transporter ATPase [Candidatus Dadabacteria bacterium]